MHLQDQCATHGGEAVLAGLDRKTGRVRWMQRFGNVSTYPEVWSRDGKMHHEASNPYDGFLEGFCPPLVRILHDYRSALQGPHVTHRRGDLSIRVPLDPTDTRVVPVVIQRMQWIAERKIQDQQGRFYYAPAHRASAPLRGMSLASLGRAMQGIACA